MAYNDMYDTFDDVNIPYSFPYSFQTQNKDYLISNNKAKIYWNYGDTAQAIFAIHLGDSGIILSDYTIQVEFYNFRFEPIHLIEYVPNVDEEIESITVTIDKETSSNVFKKGTYYCSLKLVNDSTSMTLLAPENCLVYVK